MRTTAFEGLSTREEMSLQFSLMDSKDVPTELLSWIHQISRLNLWQEALHFLKLPISESVQTLSQVKSSETGVLTNSSSSTSIMCELLISTFLYYGHGESAFLLWRKSSTVFNFAPPPMLMMKLAVYAILVDEQAQEALDLASMVSLQTDSMKKSEKTLLKCFELWIKFYITFLNLKKSVLREGEFKLDNSAEEVFLKLLCLACSPSSEDTGELPVKKGPHLALHAVLLLISLEGGKEELQRVMPLLSDDKCTFQCLQQVANILLDNFIKSKPHELFLPNTFIFLLEHLFPIPLDCCLKNGKPVLSGLPVYQCFFDENNKTQFKEEEGEEKKKKKRKNVSFPSSTIHSTVGFVLLKRLQEHSLLRPFIYSIVSYDIVRTNSSLLIHVMKTPVNFDTNKEISQNVGQQLLSIVKEVIKHNFQTEKHPLLILGYISRILAPFLNYGSQKRQDNPQVTESSLLVNENFYIYLLISLVEIVHGSDVKAWQRLVEVVTNIIVKKKETGLQTLLPLSIRMQLHLRWWLPNLLTLTDTTREGFIFMKLKKPLFLESTKEWDSIVCGILWNLSEKEIYSKDTKNIGWIQSNSDISKKEQNIFLNYTTNELNMILNVERLLVQRFIRWEWLLKGIWEFVHESNIDRHYTLWENLLRVCSSTLERCRLFHRNDIARDLMEVLFFPAKPFLASNSICDKSICIDNKKDNNYNNSRGINGNSVNSTMAMLLFAGIIDNSTRITLLMEWRWRFFDEIFRWLFAFQAWDRIQEVQYWPPSHLHSTHQCFLSLQWYLEDLNRGMSKNKTIGSSEQKRVRDLFDWYESVACMDVSLRIPQILLPLARALQRGKLLNCLSTLLRNTFNDLNTKFHQPRNASMSRKVKDGLIFLCVQYNVNVACMKRDDTADVTAELSHSAYENAQRTIAALVEVYILTLWENNYFSEVKTMLLKPISFNPDSRDSQVSSLISYPEKTKEMISLFNCDDIAFLLPVSEREAMRLLLILTLAQHYDESSLSILFRQLPRFKADPTLVIANIQRLVNQEPHLFTPFADTAQKLSMGTIRLREACTTIALQYRKKEEQGKIMDLKNGKEEAPIHNMRDLNRCIDNCNWELALEAIPRIVAEPLHAARKGLLACEKAPKGMAWEGAMRIFMNSNHTWEKHQSQNTKKTSSSSSSFSFTVGIQELGRIMTLLANAKRWREALQIFESLTPSAIDGYIFSQTCFALCSGGHPELGVDVWAKWRAAVGDAVEPTAQMCGHFLRCGVTGDTAMADAACLMLKESVTKRGSLCKEKGEEEKDKKKKNKNKKNIVPGTDLPLSLEKEERNIITLLRDRWHESWQKALQLALVSGRPRIIEAVSWRTPSNYHLYKAFMQDAAQKGRHLSLEERSAIAGHLDIKTALETEKSTNGASKDRTVRVLQEILGEENDDNNDNKNNDTDVDNGGDNTNQRQGD
ncbi:putative ubiquitin-protein ligase-like [Trypanosoma theileri]|uniref:Putative ubiquitin-protein ligase-like n=1 Tax=Trypanosoma theileri TaxID=67003 RepID=A0A1X0NNK3_9TRYP|nr:putative ubiquitin-protein ligase-like [Trypanosoma theileri]ORC86277.1 putative ubiquitin-protein ligase-like [Trypanosoma theileri]